MRTRSSVLFARWQQQFCYGWGSTPKYRLPLEVRDPHLTQCVTGPHLSVPAKWHLNSSNGLSRVNKCDRRQTDHATEKCVAIGGIACTRAILFNNTKWTNDNDRVETIIMQAANWTTKTTSHKINLSTCSFFLLICFIWLFTNVWQNSIKVTKKKTNHKCK